MSTITKDDGNLAVTIAVTKTTHGQVKDVEHWRCSGGAYILIRMPCRLDGMAGIREGPNVSPMLADILFEVDAPTVVSDRIRGEEKRQG